MAPVASSDLYPAVRRFLLESGLQRALKAFDKETEFDEEAAPAKGKKAKALASLELTEACRLWLEGRQGVSNGEAAAATEEEPKKKKKRKASAGSEAAVVAEEEAPAPAAEEERPKKKRRKTSDAAAAAAAQVAVEEPAAEVEVEKPKKEKKKEKKAEERVPGVPFKRIDDSKWISTIKDSRLMDNTHKAKDRFGDSAGDSWGDRAAEDMLKVKGKGFRKEMQKKKRSSWRGAGAIDQGVNSVKFDDSSDEE